MRAILVDVRASPPPPFLQKRLERSASLDRGGSGPSDLSADGPDFECFNIHTDNECCGVVLSGQRDELRTFSARRQTLVTLFGEHSLSLSLLFSSSHPSIPDCP